MGIRDGIVKLVDMFHRQNPVYRVVFSDDKRIILKGYGEGIFFALEREKHLSKLSSAGESFVLRPAGRVAPPVRVDRVTVCSKATVPFEDFRAAVIKTEGENAQVQIDVNGNALIIGDHVLRATQVSGRNCGIQANLKVVRFFAGAVHADKTLVAIGDSNKHRFLYTEFIKNEHFFFSIAVFSKHR
jgi:hypothetical protein